MCRIHTTQIQGVNHRVDPTMAQVNNKIYPQLNCNELPLDEVFFALLFRQTTRHLELSGWFKALNLSPGTAVLSTYHNLINLAIAILAAPFDTSEAFKNDDCGEFDEIVTYIDLDVSLAPHILSGMKGFKSKRRLVAPLNSDLRCISTFNSVSRPSTVITGDNVSHLDPEDDGDDITTMASAASFTATLSQAKTVYSKGETSDSGMSDSSTMRPESSFNQLDEATNFDLSKNKIAQNVIWILGCMLQNLRDVSETTEDADDTKSKCNLSLLANYLEGKENQWLMKLVFYINCWLVKLLDITCHKNTVSTDEILLLGELILSLARIFGAVVLTSVPFDGSPHSIATYRLYLAFHRVDLTVLFDKFIKLSSGQKCGLPSPEPNPIQIPVDTMSRVMNMIALLAYIPASYAKPQMSEMSNKDQLQATGQGNIYWDWLVRSDFDQVKFMGILKVLCASNLKEVYSIDRDLMIHSAPGNWFSRFVPGIESRCYKGVDTLEILIKNVAQQSFLASTQSVDTAGQEIGHKAGHNATPFPFQNLANILPITLILRIFVQDSEFLSNLVSTSAGSEMRLIDCWLCAVSYAFAFQIGNPCLQLLSVNALDVMLKLVTSGELIIGNMSLNDISITSVYLQLATIKIDEFQCKLFHQKPPLVPLMLDDSGYKPCLMYMLDTLQVFLRFNLVGRLNFVQYRKAIKLITEIAGRSAGGHQIIFENYLVQSLFAVIFSVVRFVWVHHKANSRNWKHHHDDAKNLMESLLFAVDTFLDPSFSNVGVNLDQSISMQSYMSFQIVYTVLLHHQVLCEILHELKDVGHVARKTRRILDCIKYFEQRFHMTEESKLEQDGTSKINLFEYDDNSAEFKAHIAQYLKSIASKPYKQVPLSPTNSQLEVTHFLSHSEIDSLLLIVFS